MGKYKSSYSSSQAYSNFYNNYSYMDPRFGGYNFYIHRHMDRIGLMSSTPGGSLGHKVSGSDIEQEYKKLYTIKNVNNESIVSAAVKEQYIDLLKNKIKNSDGISYFNKITEEGVGPYSDNLIKAMNEHLESYLRQNLTADYIAKLIQNFNKFNWNWTNNKEDLKKPLQKLEQKNVLSNLNALIDNVIEGVSLLSQTKNADLALFSTFQDLLKGINNQSYSSMNELGTALVNKMQDFQTTTTLGNKTVSAKALNNLIDSLVIVGKQLKYGKSGIQTTASGADDISSGKDLTLQALKDTFDKLIYPEGFGETAAGLGIMCASDALKQELMLIVKENHMHYTGKDTGYLEIKDPQNQDVIIEKYMGDTPQAIKTDIEQQNVGMHFFVTDQQQNIYELNFVMDLGLSIKTYRSKSIFGDSNWGNQKISVGGGMTLGAAIMSLPIDNYIKYLGFNAVSYRKYKDMKPAYEEIKAVAFMRSMLYLFSSRTSTDFAQFIFINGMLVSVWDIINYVFTNIDMVMKGGAATGVSFAVKENGGSVSKDESRKKTKQNDEFNEADMINRVKLINKNINTMKMTGSVAPRKVLNWAGKM